MSFLLDTNILSAHLRRPTGLAHRLIQHSGRLYCSSVALAELYVWAYNKTNSASALACIAAFLHYEVSVIPYDVASAQEFGSLKVLLRSRGIQVPSLDLMIDSVALASNLTLVTNNTADFIHIPALRLEDWLSPCDSYLQRPPHAFHQDARHRQ